MNGAEFLISFNGPNSNILIKINDRQHEVHTLNSKAFRRSNPRRICLSDGIASPSLCNMLPNGK